MADRSTIEAEWLALTRRTLPGLAAARRWPVRADHCFQRILLDNAVGGCWYDVISGRPAYRHCPAELLEHAIALGREAIGGSRDLAVMNRQSLQWRGKVPSSFRTSGIAPAPLRRHGRGA